MSNIILSNENKKIINSLKNLGFNLIFSEEKRNLLSFERKHADMQCLKIEDTFFVLKSCKHIIDKLQILDKKVIETDKDIKGIYPENVLLNAVYIDSKLYCKEESLDFAVKKYCKNNNIEIVNINQGYTKCSTAVFGDCFITADKGIFKAISENGV
ncbi:MAG: hypothetical protein J1E41_07830, partial [Ruminococcus sp.]|nr:hypothetical protein [Ruminococcus sp.]